MKKKWRVTLGLMVLLLSLSLIVACSSNNGDNGGQASAGEGSNAGGGTDEVVEIEVWTWPNNDATFEKLTIPMFEEKFPHIKVNVQAFGADVYQDRLSTALIAGEGPDVAMVLIEATANFREMGMFEDLSQEPYNVHQYKDKYVDLVWNYIEDENGYVFALPKNPAPGAMFYNKRVFEEAGLPTDPMEVHEVLKTWDDFIAAAEKIVIPGQRWMLGTPNQIRDVISHQAASSYFTEDGEIDIDNPVFMDIYRIVQELHEMGAFAPFHEWSTEWNGTMQTGSVAVYMYGNWFGRFLKNNAEGTDGDWGVTFAPAYNGQHSFNNGGDFIGIVSTSKHKEEAWEFIKFVSQDLGNLEAMYVEDDLYPGWIEALDLEWMNKPDEFFGGQVTNEIFSVVAEEMAAPRVTKYDPIAKQVTEDLLMNITLGGMDIESALEWAKEELRAHMED